MALVIGSGSRLLPSWVSVRISPSQEKGKARHRVPAATSQATSSTSNPPRLDALEAVSSKTPWIDAIIALSRDSSM